MYEILKFVNQLTKIILIGKQQDHLLNGNLYPAFLKLLLCLFFSGSSKYFPAHKLPENVVATTDARAALQGADFCFHAVPVQVVEFLFYSSAFRMKEILT